MAKNPFSSSDLLPDDCLLVSACLLGKRCRYDGRDSLCPDMALLSSVKKVVSICPEIMGGLPVPRLPANIVGGDGFDVLAGRARVINSAGEDVSHAFIKGAEKALDMAKNMGISRAILKTRSPSCGMDALCKDKPSGRGIGVTAALLQMNGIRIVELDREESLLSKLRLMHGET